MASLCSVEGCGRKHSCKGYCDGHYQRLRDGKPVDVPLLPKVRSDGSCKVDGCDRKHWSSGLCSLHYQRQRSGVPMDFEGRIYGVEVCTVEGCEKPYHGGGYCGAHWMRAKLGQPLEGPVKTVIRGEIPGYGATHDRIRQVRGPASAHLCPCGKPATEWALDNDSPNIIIEVMEHRQTAGMRYSLDPMDYSPMCTACHQKMDYDWHQANG